MAERAGLAAVLLACCAAGCGISARGTPHTTPGAPPVPDRVVVLNGHALRLHFAPGTRGAARPLLVYATGDGGWHRKDLAAFHQLVSFGFPTVGFDARDYVTHLGCNSTTPAGLARDYEQIISAAKDTLQLPPRYPVVLVGVSRGAGLSVVAAGSARLRPAISGVLAVALTREEEYVKWFRRLRRREPRPAAPEMVEVYEYLPRLAAMPIAVVQSTRDGYLPAAAARELFGADTPHRWFQAIEARNHSFGGARPQLYEAMRRSLSWIAGLLSSPSSAPPSPAAPGG